jgi:hypothetical protein
MQNIEANVGADGSLTSLNTKYNIVKEIPKDVLVSMNNSLFKYRVRQETLTFYSTILTGSL